MNEHPADAGPSDAQETFNAIRLLMKTPVKTRDGSLVRLTRWEVWDDAPIHGIVDGENKERFWMADGRYVLGSDSGYDLFIDRQKGDLENMHMPRTTERNKE